MADLIIQFVTMISFMLGIVAGELLVHKVFGSPKSRAVFIIDILAMALLISFIYSYMEFYAGNILFYIINFAVGAFVIMVVRAVEWSIGLTQKDIMSGGNTLEIIRMLAHYGLDRKEIGVALKRLGISPRKVDEYSHLIEKAVPAYVPRFVKIEKTLERIEKRLSKIEKK